jgi:hypothetical protein
MPEIASGTIAAAVPIEERRFVDRQKAKAQETTELLDARVVLPAAPPLEAPTASQARGGGLARSSF